MNESILTFSDLLKNILKNHGERTALHFDRKKMTYQELHIASNRVANALIDSGVKRNTVVGLLLSNSFEYVISDIGIYFSGGTKVPLNNMLSEQDIHYILEDTEAEVLIVEEAFYDNIKNIQSRLPKLKTIVIVGDRLETPLPNGFISWEEFQSNKSDKNPEVSINPDDLSFIIYSGGTTGKPKGTVHSHRTTSLTTFSIILETNIREDEKILLTTPLPHAASLYLYAGLTKGAEVFIESKFDLETVLELIEKNRITFLSLVPTLIYRIIDFMEDKTFDVSSVRTIQYGTAPITTERLKQGLEIFGQVFMQIYGQAETQSAATWLKKEDHRIDEGYSHLLASCGKSTIFSRIKIIDPDGNELPAGAEGEIAVKALTNMIRYHNMPEQTAKTLKDGWIQTGDIGIMDEKGYLYLLDRKNDMIISGGMNVYSSEVENVIQKHPGVRQVAVIGIPDEDWGEAVITFVIPKDESVTVDSIKEYSKKELSKYKNPKEIQLVDSLPLTPYGKIDKKALRTPYWDVVGRRI